MNALQLHADWQPKPTYVLSDAEQQTRKVKSGSKVWRNPRLSFESLPEPHISHDEVLLQVAAVGICGSDMHMYEAGTDGYILYPGLTRFPNTLGHEFSGRVVEVGRDVRGIQRGDLVAVEEVNWCGVCDACRRGLVNHCTQMEEIGFTTPGAMAQMIAVKAKYCWPLTEIAERMGDEREATLLGAMVEPTGVSYHAIFNRLNTWKPGVTVAVFGGGPIGLAAIALARAGGASHIIAFDVSDKRLDMARTMGATTTLNPQDMNVNEALLELTRGHGVDFVVEAAGAPQHTLSPLTNGLAVGASIAHIGRSERPTSLALEHYQVRGVQLAGSLGHAGHGTFPNVIRLMASGKLDMRPMVSAILPLNDALAAFKRLEAREDAKIILMPNGTV
jgi:threonine dehydrogenase-like Zn-dependent dehydrogenase